MTSLHRLHFNHTLGASRHLGALTNLPMLSTIDLSGTKTKDEDLAPITEMKSLAELSLGGTAVTNAGMKHLAKAPALKRVWLNETAVNGEGVRALAASRSLRCVHLGQVTDEALAVLRKADKLHLLAEAQAPGRWYGREKFVEDDKEIRFLRLHGAAVTDKGLAELTGLQNLASIDLRGTKVTAAGVARLRKALPKTRVQVSPDILPEPADRPKN